MVKKILLTIAALPAAALISFVAVIVTLASIFGGQTQYYDSLKGTSQGAGIGYIIIVLGLVIFGVFAYLIWRNFWKIAFVIFLPIVILGIGGDLSHITSWHALDAISDIGIVFAMLGLFSFAFNVPLLSKGFWRIFFGLYLIENIYELFVRIVPQSSFHIPNYLVGYNTKLNFGQPSYTTIAIMLIVEIPTFYALFLLATRSKK